MGNQSFNQLNSSENSGDLKVIKRVTKKTDNFRGRSTYGTNGKFPKELTDINKYFDDSFRSLIQVDGNQCIKNFSPGASDQVNLRASDVGRPLTDLTNHIKNFNLAEAVKSVIQSNKAIYEQVETSNDKWFYLLITPIIGSVGNEAKGANISFHDITKLTLSKLQADKDNIKLTRINKDHENFIYSVSHDLKSPLNSLEALVTLINSTDNIEGIKELTSYLMKSVVGLRQTINELSSITEIEKNLDGEESIKLPELIEEIKWSLRDLLNEAFAIVNIELDVNEINFSKKNLRSVLYNFLCNAVKYKSNNRQLKIDIKTTIEDSNVVLSVTDNGIGISENQIDSIFSKFKRIDANEISIEGTGIGLFLVKRIVLNAGVDLIVSSVINKGTTFKVYFPLKCTSMI